VASGNHQSSVQTFHGSVCLADTRSNLARHPGNPMPLSSLGFFDQAARVYTGQLPVASRRLCHNVQGAEPDFETDGTTPVRDWGPEHS
jgi:hypothetical protein